MLCINQLLSFWWPMTAAPPNHKLNDLNALEDLLDKFRADNRISTDTPLNTVEQLAAVIAGDILDDMEEAGFDGQKENSVFFTLSEVFPVIFGVAGQAGLKDPETVSELAMKTSQTLLVYLLQDDLSEDKASAYLNTTLNDLTK